MPIFEYKCKDCGSKFEFLHKSILDPEQASCPNCNSVKNEKLLSSFSTSNSGSSYDSGCTDGSCATPAPMGGCANGMCGLN